MAVQKLTKRAIEAASPGQGKRALLWDSEVKGLGIRCIGNGSKTFLLKFERRGQATWLTLGAFGPLTVDAARKLAAKKLGELASGKDLAAERGAWKVDPTVADVAERFLAEHVTPKLKPTTAHEYRRELDVIILPAIGKLRVTSVKTTDIARIHHKLTETPVLSNRVHALLSKLFNAVERWGLRPHGSNPTLGHEKYREASRERFLSDDELERLGVILDQSESDFSESPVVCNAIRFLLVSGWRLNEALKLKWSDLDLKAGLVRLPDTKSGAATIDVNPAMATILEAMRGHQVLGNPYVFTGKEQGGYLVNLRKPWMRICDKAGIHGVRLHDLRRTFGTLGAGEAGLSHETIGKVLRHKQTSTTAIYARLAGTARKAASEKIGDVVARKLKGKGA